MMLQGQLGENEAMCGSPMPAPHQQPAQDEADKPSTQQQQYEPRGKRGPQQDGYGFNDYNNQGYDAGNGHDGYVQISVDVGNNAVNNQVHSYASEYGNAESRCPLSCSHVQFATVCVSY